MTSGGLPGVPPWKMEDPFDPLTFSVRSRDHRAFETSNYSPLIPAPCALCTLETATCSY